MEKSNKNKKPKHKLDPERGITLEVLLASHPQCKYLIKNKMKLCNMAKTPGSDYCGVHRPFMGETEALSRKEREAYRISAAKGDGVSSMERVPCPLDPTHTVFKNSLKKHLQVCTAKQQRDKVEAEPYYCQDCNSGAKSSLGESEGEGTGKGEEESNSYRGVDATKLLKKLEACYFTFCDDIHCLPSEHDTPTLTQEEEKMVQEVGGAQTSHDRLRHVRQNALIVRQMRKAGLLSPPSSPIPEAGGGETRGKHTFVEMGAGAGALGMTVHCVDKSAYIVFVERGSTSRRAVDRTLRRQGKVDCFSRARVDIRHCKVSALPGVKGTTGKVVVIAKHLCGVASDLAIHSTRDPDLRQGDGVGRRMEVGVCVATCCHHACSWADYAGKQWLQDAGFTREEFNLLKHWSGWCTGLQGWWSGFASARRGGLVQKEGDSAGPSEKRSRVENRIGDKDGIQEGDQDREGVSNVLECNGHGPVPGGDFPRPPNISSEAMARAGYITKRVLDEGRCQALKATGLQVRQVQYCSPRESPECFVILAWPAEQR